MDPGTVTYEVINTTGGPDFHRTLSPIPGTRIDNLAINSSSWNSSGRANQTLYDLELCERVKADFNFNHVQIIRVVITWILFAISAVGNLFVLSCVYRKAKISHVHMIMMHFTIADLAFTFLVMPNDAIWNTTMEWKVGEFLCKLCQMFKQMGMYISSFMVVVIALDRCCSILQPMSTPSKQRKRTKYLVGGAWILSILSAVPPAVMFSVMEVNYCPDRPPFQQCVDFHVVPIIENRRPYYFFTMFMTFILPMVFTVVSYSLVICEISNMMKRDRVMMGRRDSCNNITRARKKTLIMTSMVTLTFVLLWGPYYAFALYDWFNPTHSTPREVTMVLFVIMYVHPAIHPFLYGVFMKDVRVGFGQTMSAMEKIVTCSTTELGYGEKTLNCLSSERKARVSGSRYSKQSNCPTDVRPIGNRTDPNLPTQYPDRSDSESQNLITDLPERGTRCSTVTFQLFDSLPETVLATNNNNEKEVLPESLEDDVFKSTIL